MDDPTITLPIAKVHGEVRNVIQQLDGYQDAIDKAKDEAEKIKKEYPLMFHREEPTTEQYLQYIKDTKRGKLNAASLHSN